MKGVLSCENGHIYICMYIGQFFSQFSLFGQLEVGRSVNWSDFVMSLDN